MSYKLKKPFSQQERVDFICKYGQDCNSEFGYCMQIKETENALYALEQNEIWDEAKQCPIVNEYYETELAIKREESFKDLFFEIEGYGWFRKAPKGYSSAVEAMSAAFNMVSIVGYLPANTLTFYTEPDFTDETQCTEEWLVTNSYKNDELTITAFGTLYAKFLEGWNKLEHKYSIFSNR